MRVQRTGYYINAVQFVTNTGANSTILGAWNDSIPSVTFTTADEISGFYGTTCTCAPSYTRVTEINPFIRRGDCPTIQLTKYSVNYCFFNNGGCPNNTICQVVWNETICIIPPSTTIATTAPETTIDRSTTVPSNVASSTVVQSSTIVSLSAPDKILQESAVTPTFLQLTHDSVSWC